MLEKEIVGNVVHTIFGKCLHQYRCAEKTCLETVVVLFEILSQSGNHILFCLCFHKTVLQGKERRGLHCVQYRHLEIARPVEELLFQICLRGLSHRRILRLIASCSLGHITHHRGIDCPITCAQIVPILFDILSQDRDTESVLLIKFTVAFKRLITEPVSPLIIAVF